MLITRLLREMFFPEKKPMSTSPQSIDIDTHDGIEGYSFTDDWFSVCIPAWRELLSQMSGIVKVLEIGSFEGRSTIWLIENAFEAGGLGELYCIDTWKGGMEHSEADMTAVEERFLQNIATAKSRSRSNVVVHVLKGTSSIRLATLVSEGHSQSFDVIHVDGSHQCPDVLSDLVLAFQLCKVGGLILCDDYEWSHEPHGSEDLLNQPKMAIDSFVNCYRRKLRVVGFNLRQLYLGKTSN